MSEIKNKNSSGQAASSHQSGSLEHMVSHDLSSDLITNHDVPSFADAERDQRQARTTHTEKSTSTDLSQPVLQDQDPQQELATVLMTARVGLGLSIESLAERSLVHSRFIRCLEQARDPEIAQTYLRGYLKLLAEHLGLDPQRLLTLHASTVALNDQQASARLEQQSVEAATSSTSFMGQLGTVSTEALGAVAVACARVKRVFSTSSRGPAVQAKSGARRVSQPSAAHASDRPKALVREGTAWHSPSLLRVSNGLPWRAVAVSMMCLAFIAGVYVDVADESTAPSLVDSSDVDGPQAELAAEALGVELPLDDANDPSNRLVPLNQQERRAALAGLEQTAGTAAVETQPSNAAIERGNDAAQRSRLVAIESSVSAGDSVVLEAGAENASVRSVINVGELSGGRVASATAGSAANSGALSDSYEPVGPGAEYMISQHAMQDRLVISVYEDSWVDVRDAKGVRLYRNLAKAGRRIDLSGELPFSLHVGNAPGLALELNGDYVPIERYRSDNSARLTLVDTPNSQ